MLYKIPLKNSELTALVDDKAYEYLSENEYLKSVNFLKNLRLHSSGYAFFQKSHSTSKGMYKTVTIYLHKLLAEKFIEKPNAKKRLYVLLRNGERLDCRVENLEWATFSKVTRNTRKRESKAGFRGVHQEREKFRAVIYRDGKRFDLGLFDTAEEAAQAYNIRSEEFFGKTIGLNKV